MEFYCVRALLFVDNPSGKGFWSNVHLLDKVNAYVEEQGTQLTQEAKSISNPSDDANKETRLPNQLLDIIGDILEQVHKLLLGFHLYSRIDLQFI